MEKVQCIFCTFLDHTRCTKKKAKVKPTKKRICNLFRPSKAALQQDNKSQMITTSPWLNNAKKTVTQAGKSEQLLTGDPKHPLTGDLSRFVKSTVSDK